MSMCSIAVPWMNNTHWSRSIDDSMNSDNFLSDYSFSLSFVNWMNASLLHRHVSSLFLSTSDYITNHLQSGLGKHQVSTGATVGVYSSAPYNDRLVVRVCQLLCTLWSHCNIIFHLCGYWAAVWLPNRMGRIRDQYDVVLIEWRDGKSFKIRNLLHVKCIDIQFIPRIIQ